jgi:hypothetical protein
MRTIRKTESHFIYRILLTSALVVASILLLARLSESLPVNSIAVKAGNLPKSDAFSRTDSLSTYRWNLSDNGLPLLSLPDHVGPGVDLSLTYSMDHFQFPLFQSLYYNQGAGKYVFMVGEGRLWKFINLDPVEGRSQFAATDNSGLHLTDNGALKLLSTAEGTVYTFASFADGELHCNQIKDRSGIAINLRYTDEASIDSIVDTSGRTISFNYTKRYVSSITQTWGRQAAKKQTWAIAEDSRPSKFAMDVVPAGSEMAKHIPTNAITPAYTEAMAVSDRLLATLFGGPGAVAAGNGFEPLALANQYPAYRGDLIGDDGKIRRGHLSYAMHLYGSADGTADSELYVPLGFISHSKVPTPTDAAITFYYPRLGNFTNVTLAVFHIANFRLSSEEGRVRIGNIGGSGGSVTTYKHSHIEFYRGDTGLPPAAVRSQLRIDPATVFESMSEAASRSKRQT